MAERKLRPIRVEGNVAYITLTRGYEAVIDADDAPLVSGANWCSLPTKNTVYAVRGEMCDGKLRTIYLHRVVMRAVCSSHIDHVDRNGLNNRKANLRKATKAQNQWNTGQNARNTSGFKGVSWDRGTNKWRAQISAGRGRKYLGVFITAEEAHAAYQSAAAEMHGTFAVIQPEQPGAF